MSQYNNAILNEREKTHGDYGENARTAQDLKSVLRAGANWNELSLAQRESLDLICTKLGRILSGNPHEADHWKDLAGYASLIEERINAATR
jgi:hypothetical protein